MQRISKNKILFVAACVMYIYLIIKSREIERFEDIYSGVAFNGQMVFYIITLYMFSVVLFYMFGETEKYITGYGILQVIRSRKRDMIVKNIIVKQCMAVTQLIIIEVILYIIELAIFDNGNVETDIWNVIKGVAMFALVCISLLLWQAILEIIFDSRIAIVMVLSFVLLNLNFGDAVFVNEYSKNLHLIGYVNMGMTARMVESNINIMVAFTELVIICVLQIVILKVVLKKKDIFSVRV